MSKKQIRINEYYDLFDVKYNDNTLINNDGLPTKNKDTFNTNNFRGFYNQLNYQTAQQAADNVQIKDKYRAPQANNSLSIDDNGDILCYPPPVNVAYWSKVIFRNFDYTIQPHNISNDAIDASAKKYSELLDKYYLYHTEEEPSIHWLPDGSTSEERAATWAKYINKPTDWHGGYIIGGPTSLKTPQPDPSFSQLFPPVKTVIKDYNNVPLFLKFDNYQSRTKVIFSGVDKTRNPDIEYMFDYRHSSDEPIKLNLSLSGSIPLTDITNGNRYNVNLSKNEINKLLVKCYFCIEWFSDFDFN